MPLDIYSTRAQLAALELMPPVYTFLYDTFCADMGAVEDDKAIYDYRKGSSPMAPFVVPGTGGVLMGRRGYETKEIGFTTIAPERHITVPDVSQRGFGERVLGAMTPEQRAKRMQAMDLMEMRAAIARRIEWMLRQVLLSGKLEIFRYTNEGLDKETTLVADYNFTNNFTPANPWSGSDAKIDYDMRKMRDLLYEGGGVAEVMVMSPDVAEIMMSNDKYAKLLDNRGIDIGKINTRYKGQGVRLLGVNGDGVEMYSFSGKFEDDDGKRKPILPEGSLLLGGKGIIKCLYGPVTQVEEDGPKGMPKTYIKKEVPLRYAKVETNSVKNRLTSCPTMVPFNVDAWVLANVL